MTPQGRKTRRIAINEIYKITDNQIDNLETTCFKIHALGVVLDVDRIASNDIMIIEEWEKNKLSQVVSSIAKIIQELVEKVVDDLNEVKVSKSDRKEVNYGNLS